MKAFIIMFNWLTWPKAMAEYLTALGCEVILIDNNSSYPPLLQWYENCPFKVHRMQENFGHLALWKSGLIDSFDDQYYIVTDPDLDIFTDVPFNFLATLKQGLLNNPDVIKSGLSLKIDDLPDNAYAKRVYEWELKFWQTPVDNEGFYKSDIDTTFAMYDRTRYFGQLPNNRFFSGVRSPAPYTARHLPWYFTEESVLNNDEQKYYLRHTNTYWATQFKETIVNPHLRESLL